MDPSEFFFLLFFGVLIGVGIHHKIIEKSFHVVDTSGYLIDIKRVHRRHIPEGLTPKEEESQVKVTGVLPESFDGQRIQILERRVRALRQDLEDLRTLKLRDFINGLLEGF